MSINSKLNIENTDNQYYFEKSILSHEQLEQERSLWDMLDEDLQEIYETQYNSTKEKVVTLQNKEEYAN